MKMLKRTLNFLLHNFILCLGNVGGALKPTDVAPLWVHVTCAWFQPEVSFASDEKMEPALGILRIPSSSYVKVMLSPTHESVFLGIFQLLPWI